MFLRILVIPDPLLHLPRIIVPRIEFQALLVILDRGFLVAGFEVPHRYRSGTDSSLVSPRLSLVSSPPVLIPILFSILLVALDQGDVLFFDVGEEAFYVDGVWDVPGFVFELLAEILFCKAVAVAGEDLVAHQFEFTLCEVLDVGGFSETL